MHSTCETIAIAVRIEHADGARRDESFPVNDDATDARAEAIHLAESILLLDPGAKVSIGEVPGSRVQLRPDGPVYLTQATLPVQFQPYSPEK